MKITNAALIREMEPEEIKDFAQRIYNRYGGDLDAMSPADKEDLQLCSMEYKQITGSNLTYKDLQLA